MIELQFHLAGIEEVNQHLDLIKPENALGPYRKALRAGGEVLKAALIEKAPVKLDDIPGGDSLPPGFLRDDIQMHLGRDENNNLRIVVGPGKYSSHVARWLEYGHRMVTGGRSRVVKGKNGKEYTRGPGKVHATAVQAYPWIRPGFEAAAQEALDAFLATLKEELEKQITSGVQAA